VKTAEVKSYGLGSSKTKLVKYVIEIVKEDKDKDVQNWVVFDMDIRLDSAIKDKEDYDNAIQLAEKNKIKVAFANDAFELWFLLHYLYFDNKWTRQEYYQKLSELWGCNYEKLGKKLDFCKGIYKRLQEDEQANQEEAIERAERLLSKYEDEQLRYSDKNPSTSIHLLVKELNKYI